jgi:peptide/nickel transport system ATP-binding protein
MSAMSEAALLAVEDLEVGFDIPRGIVGTALRRPAAVVRAVDGISLQVQSGELVALVGESGCGKTTTALATMGLLPATGGTIRIEGQDLGALSGTEARTLRRRVQMIFQDPYESLDPRFTVRRTVLEPMLVHDVEGDRDELVSAALERVGLHPAGQFLDRHPHELSGGQRQRVAIAAALVLAPALLVADEPVSMLDTSVRAGVLELLAELRGDGMGILMITHDLSTAARYADRICVMYLGRIVEEGPARRVVTKPKHPYTKALVAAVPRSDGRPRDMSLMPEGETPHASSVPSGCRFHPRCPVAMPTCDTEDPVLETVGENHRAACLLLSPASSAGSSQ